MCSDHDDLPRRPGPGPLLGHPRALADAGPGSGLQGGQGRGHRRYLQEGVPGSGLHPGGRGQVRRVRVPGAASVQGSGAPGMRIYGEDVGLMLHIILSFLSVNKMLSCIPKQAKVF